MAKGCPEEFNPWPPFVDIFASVILVLMLFLLITVVNIGYYAQFKSKSSYTAQSNIKSPDDTSNIVQTVTPEGCIPMPTINETYTGEGSGSNLVSFRKMIKPQVVSDGTNSFFSGGEGDGNSVSYRNQKKAKVYDNHNLVQSNRKVEIYFKDKDIFIPTSVKHKIRQFISGVNRSSKSARFTIYVHDPSGIVSSTIAKQISLGRILNIKNIIKKNNISASRIKMDLQNSVLEPSKYGSLVIKAVMP